MHGILFMHFKLHTVYCPIVRRFHFAILNKNAVGLIYHNIIEAELKKAIISYEKRKCVDLPLTHPQISPAKQNVDQEVAHLQ